MTIQQTFDALFDRLTRFNRRKPDLNPCPTFNDRLMAALIDMACIALLLFVPFTAVSGWLFNGMDLQGVMRSLGPNPSPDAVSLALRQYHVAEKMMINAVFQIAVMGSLTVYCWHRWRGTPGKLLMNMRLVTADTQTAVPLPRLVLRYAAYYISALPLMLGFFWIAFTKERRGWHDRIAGTQVIRVTPWWQKKEEVSSIPQSADPSNSQAPASPE